jgi:uncharacterized protein (TIGR02147 family)
MNLESIDSYCSFVREFLHRKSPKQRGQIAKLAEHLGVHPTFVSQVLSGAKHFSLEQSFAVTTFFELTETEQKYFLLLVQKDRAGTKELRKYFENELSNLRKDLLLVSKRLPKHRDLTEEHKAIFYSSWLYSGVRLFCSVGDGQTIENVVERFRIGRIKAASILGFLVEVGLCTKEGENYRLGSQHTHVESTSPFSNRHHMNWRNKALQLHENKTVEELVLTAPMSISVKDFQKIRESLLNCIKENFEIAKDSSAEEIAFLNIDFLWLRQG